MLKLKYVTNLWKCFKYRRREHFSKWPDLTPPLDFRSPSDVKPAEIYLDTIKSNQTESVLLPFKIAKLCVLNLKSGCSKNINDLDIELHHLKIDNLGWDTLEKNIK